MKKLSLKSIAIIIVFVLLIGVPLVAIQWGGSEYSESEKRYLAPVPTFKLADGSINPNLGEEVKSWLEDHIGLRSLLVNLAGRIRLNVFHQSPSEQVHIGSDGWYFYTVDDNLKIADGTYPLSDEALQQILNNHLAIRDKLRAQGIDYVIILPVSKVSIYPEYLRGVGNGQVRQTPVDIVADYLENNSDLKVIRLKETLLEAKNDGQVFFKTDTHWNYYGAYIAYRQIIDCMTDWGLCETDKVDVDFVDAERLCEFGAMMGSTDFLPPEPYRETVIPSPRAVEGTNTARNADGTIWSIATNEGIYNPCSIYENSAVSGPRVLMYGDSMFGGWNMAQLLAENFPEFTFIWDYDIRQSLIDFTAPDVVIYEITERFLNLFPSKNSAFLFTPLSDYDARIIDYTWHDYDIHVTVQNSSQSAWQEADRIRCCVWLNGVDTGIRGYIPAGTVVQPGEQITITLPNVYPAESDVLAVQMLQEGYMYFGQQMTVEH